jgi:hypothetical protein
MKMGSWSSILPAATVLAAALFLGSLRTPAQNGRAGAGGATFEGEIMDNHCALMGSHEMTMTATKLATPDLCVSYCMYFQKTPDKFVLYNPATKMVYQLDDQNQAMFFGGRKVKVTGSYDASTKTIHVKDIVGASS